MNLVRASRFTIPRWAGTSKRRRPGPWLLRDVLLKAEALAGDLEKRFPEDTFVKFTYVPVLRALTALERGKPADSVERLQIALRYELAVNGLNFIHFIWAVCIRPMCAARHCCSAPYAEAVAEFQKILNHRVSWGWIPRRAGALATGQGVRFVGRSEQGEAAYEDFLALWKDADPDIPILKSAKAEYVRL